MASDEMTIPVDLTERRDFREFLPRPSSPLFAKYNGVNSPADRFFSYYIQRCRFGFRDIRLIEYSD